MYTDKTEMNMGEHVCSDRSIVEQVCCDETEINIGE